ncbi:TniB protein [Anopheles sinensis]|uniref:TniB protein n=1 Tax=Anopheles sinensis TaxID=74873 RepID=A0A084WBQ6_ANOSI|nr:TniB protein [Anopheles sinensis]
MTNWKALWLAKISTQIKDYQLQRSIKRLRILTRTSCLISEPRVVQDKLNIEETVRFEKLSQLPNNLLLGDDDNVDLYVIYDASSERRCPRKRQHDPADRPSTSTI